jgi:radial spoke head protein 9
MVSLQNMPSLGPSGSTLSVEERAGLQVEMLQRRQAEGFSTDLKFWGRITGKTNDYLIAIAMKPAYPFPTKKFYYCTTGDFKLSQMPELSPEYKALAEGLIAKPFRGEPSLVIETAQAEEEAPPPPADGEEEVEPERFREEHRLAFAVDSIDHDVSVAPRGAYLVDASHQVVVNRAYDGLSYEAAGQLRSYFHLRLPESARAQAALEKPGIVRASDFLDPVADDKPAGSWSLSYDPSHTMAILRSFYWPGYYFYAVIGTGEFGGVYIGNGQPNVDIQFML